MENTLKMKLDNINLELINSKVYKLIEEKRPKYESKNKYIMCKFEMKNVFTGEIETYEMNKYDFNKLTPSERANLNKCKVSEIEDGKSIRKLEKENSEKRKEFDDSLLETKLKVVEESGFSIDELIKATNIIEIIDDYVSVDLSTDAKIELEEEILATI